MFEGGQRVVGGGDPIVEILDCFEEAVAGFGSVGIESAVPALVSDTAPVLTGWSGVGVYAFDRDRDAELDEGVVCPGHWCGLVNSDFVEVGENRVQEVSCDGGWVKG